MNTAPGPHETADVWNWQAGQSSLPKGPFSTWKNWKHKVTQTKARKTPAVKPFDARGRVSIGIQYSPEKGTISIRGFDSVRRFCYFGLFRQPVRRFS